MPYIRAVDRARFEETLVPFLRQLRKARREKGIAPGELNFVLSKILDNVLGVRKLDYASLNAAIGVLECAKLELYRRIVADYEDDKRFENGEVYDILKRPRKEDYRK